MQTFWKYFVYLMFILVFYSSCCVWFFCPFFVSWQGRQYYILVPRGRVLSLLIKRRFIIKCRFSFCPLEIFFSALTIPRLLASFIQSLYQVWMLSLLNYGSWGFSVTEVSSVRGNEGIIKRIQGPDTMIPYNWNKQCQIWLMLDFPSNFFIGVHSFYFKQSLKLSQFECLKEMRDQ